MIDSTLRFTHEVDQRATALAEEMVRELEAVRSRIIGRLAALQDEHLTGKDSFQEEAYARRKAYLTAQQTEIESIISEVMAANADHLREAGADVITASATQTATVLNAMGAGVVVDLGPKLVRSYVERWFEAHTVDGLTIKNFLNKLQASTVERIVSAGRRALIEGMGTQATARLIRKEGIEGSVPGLEGLARTWLLSASNYARDTVIEEQFSDVLTGWERVGTLDGRTCIRCGPKDGMIVKAGQPRTPLPEHWRCRCMWLPRTSLSGKFPQVERPATKHDARTVHHRDGSTSTKFTVSDVEFTRENYSQWLKRQAVEDPAFVRRVLGPARFDLFRAGKLSLDHMSTSGRILRLSELEV
ncbi:hypothetical protein NNJEOMEG_00038 [Fundidesulfovibrio magnetotacticus]|uniref:Phage head morphogenesis domain-containing protein n=1 Tax=Fundidesulfovibrio magnetotacticus TaxID=2730080 RepID=A0A6V8LR29_9BACT|nr:hypothetical protein [Fundidesulfovibrio magnetotacticus]GFK92216.1 hypothetical protein NNJEOMEG_00038 [Fundidesulfovibrio magnetotacticus]